ncbi:DUF6678 family protein [Pseudomonas asplenii]|uniref:DUF6678 family protein n=1 Tax=Pseudomonas asplenii TaxID=53407 RepID=UPI000380B86E|nr:DUF6678 family protein [Pseudomonas fuscovaginae]
MADGPFPGAAAPPPTTIDHTEDISKVVAGIGFEFEVGAEVLRIRGYLPKSHADFPPA